MNTIQSIVEWFKIAKPNPNNQDLIKQIAFHFEEVAEMLDAIHCDYMSVELFALKCELMAISDDKERPEIQQGFDTADEAVRYAEHILLVRELKKHFSYVNE